MAVQEIGNLMGRYAHLSLLEGEGRLEPLFAMKTDGVSWKDPMGPTGADAMRQRFSMPVEDKVRMVSLRVDSLLTPIIEVARDGHTAKGVWDSYARHVHAADEAESELWVKYGVDFIREDGEWKIWHLQVYPIFDTLAGTPLTEMARNRQDRAASTKEKIPRLAKGWTGAPEGMWLYDGRSLPKGPKLPSPYCTFNEVESY